MNNFKFLKILYISNHTQLDDDVATVILMFGIFYFELLSLCSKRCPYLFSIRTNFIFETTNMKKECQELMMKIVLKKKFKYETV